MKETFIIRNEKDAEQLQYYVHDCLQDHSPLEVVVHAGAQNRSARQNRLIWLWNTEIGNRIGLTKDEVHIMLKRRFAIPIFTRDDPDYAAMVLAIKNVRKEGHEDWAEAAAKEIARLTSTTAFTTEEMAEYMRDIERYAAEEGIQLTFPEDLYNSIEEEATR